MVASRSSRRPRTSAFPGAATSAPPRRTLPCSPFSTTTPGCPDPACSPGASRRSDPTRSSAPSPCASSTRTATAPAVTCLASGHVQPDRSGPVTAFLGGAVVIRRAAFEQVGGYAADFRYAMEETDLALRLIDDGWTIHYDGTPAVIHPRTDPSRHPAPPNGRCATGCGSPTATCRRRSPSPMSSTGSSSPRCASPARCRRPPRRRPRRLADPPTGSTQADRLAHRRPTHPARPTADRLRPVASRR